MDCTVSDVSDFLKGWACKACRSFTGASSAKHLITLSPSLRILRHVNQWDVGLQMYPKAVIDGALEQEYILRRMPLELMQYRRLHIWPFSIVYSYFSYHHHRAYHNTIMGSTIVPNMNSPSAFARKIYNPLGFAKAYNFWLWFICGGAFTGCTSLNARNSPDHMLT